MKEKTINLRNVLTIVILCEIIPMIRVLSYESANSMKNSAWLFPILSAIIFLPILLIYCYLVKHCPGKNLFQINDMIFGKIIGKVINSIYLICGIFYLAYNLNQFSIRIIGTIMPNTDSIIFLTCMIFICVYAVRLGIPTVARSSIVFIFAVFIVLGISFISLIGIIDVENLYPISSEDTLNLLMFSRVGVALLAYFLFIPIFADNLSEHDKIMKRSITALVIVIIIQVLLVMMPLGIFGYSAATTFNYPFIQAMKNVNLFGAVEKTDSIIVTVLMAGDFITCVALAFSNLKVISNFSGVKDSRIFGGIMFLLIFLLAHSIMNNHFELIEISQDVIVYANIIVCVLLPLTTFFTGLIRNKFTPATENT